MDEDGKSDSGWREISLDAFTVTALRSYVEMLNEEREAFGEDYPDHGVLMCFEDGRRLHPDTITRTFNRLVDRAGVRRIRLHDVRHYADGQVMRPVGLDCLVANGFAVSLSA